MLEWMRWTATIPQHMIERQELFLYSAVGCMAGGLLLLIIAVIVLKVRGRRNDRGKK